MLTFSAARRLAVCAFTGLVIGLLLWLPYRIPVTPTVSDSYLFGFNNRAGLALFLAFALALAALAWRAPILPLAGFASRPLTTRTLRRALLLTGLLCVSLYLVTRRFEGFQESIYLIDRTKLILEGKISYRDFEFAYGILFLYGPAALARVLHLSPVDAYLMFWILLSLAGVWLLYQTLLWLQAPHAAPRTIFLFFVAIGLLSVLCEGVNYSLFRYLLPLFLGLLIFRRLAPSDSPRPQPWAILLASPSFLVLLLVSPELALSFAFGIACYLAFFGHLRVQTNLFAYAAMLLLNTLILAVAFRSGAFDTLLAFSRGGLCFPIIPAAHILLFLAAVGITAAYTVRQLRLRQGSPLLVLIAVSAAGTAGALGRCDPIHVLMNPLGIILAALILAASCGIPGRLYRGFAYLVFAAVPLILGLPGEAAIFSRVAVPLIFSAEGSKPESRIDRYILAKMIRALGPQTGPAKYADYKAFYSNPQDRDWRTVFHVSPQTILQAPFGFTPGRFGTTHTPAVEEGFFFEDINLATPAQIQRKVIEIARHPERPMLLFPGQEVSCTRDPSGERALIRALFLYPYRAPVRNPESVSEPLCAYIREHYAPALPAAPERFGYAVWQPRP